MGKQRRHRKKYHQPVKSLKDVSSAGDTIETQPIAFSSTSNLFAGLDINVDNLNKKLDTCSIKSFKSDIGTRLPKKDKTKLRRKMLLEKLDSTIIAKKKKTKVNDLNPLFSLQSLLKEKVDTKQTKPNIKRKGTQKAVKRKRYFLNGVNLLKKLIENKEFKTNPHKIVSEHMANVGRAKHQK